MTHFLANKFVTPGPLRDIHRIKKNFLQLGQIKKPMKIIATIPENTSNTKPPVNILLFGKAIKLIIERLIPNSIENIAIFLIRNISSTLRFLSFMPYNDTIKGRALARPA